VVLFGQRRDHTVAVGGGGSEDPMVRREVHTQPGHERGEALGQGSSDRFEDFASLGGQQAIVHDLRSGGVAAELLQARCSGERRSPRAVRSPLSQRTACRS
jgi:hypothetical protein